MNDVGRTHPVHQPIREQFNTPIIVYVTVCTKDRKPILAEDEAATRSCLRRGALPLLGWGRYLTVPDHLHLFCAPTEHDSLPIINWITFWKSYAPKTMAYS